MPVLARRQADCLPTPAQASIAPCPPRNKESRMWGVLVGLYIVVIIYPFIEEWQQKRADKSALANMRRHSGLGHRWDATKGQWMDK